MSASKILLTSFLILLSISGFSQVMPYDLKLEYPINPEGVGD